MCLLIMATTSATEKTTLEEVRTGDGKLVQASDVNINPLKSIEFPDERGNTPIQPQCMSAANKSIYL